MTSGSVYILHGYFESLGLLHDLAVCVYTAWLLGAFGVVKKLGKLGTNPDRSTWAPNLTLCLRSAYVGVARAVLSIILASQILNQGLVGLELT